ncbi:MAG: N-acetylmuramoyl-L-alanine amidase, partial [Chloroflexi bacterium]|nr:N-acetylmuramoyl-L-alanine amidase [Chloroflexota bacterium]
MRAIATALLALAIVGLVLSLRPPHIAWAEPPQAYLAPQQDFDIPGGHFFKQANRLGGNGDTGYAVTDDDEAKFWSEFRRLGGVDAVGYPISRRFKWNNFVVQAFQRGVLQWRSEAQQAWFVNVFDLMHDTGFDDWLVAARSTPRPLDPSFDAGKDWSKIVRDRQALLDANPAIKARYYASPDPMTFFGLPTSKVVDNGNHFAVRLQRAVIQQWKVDVPWAKAGQVTVANGGDIGAEAGFYPVTGFDVESPSYTRNGKTVVLDPGHGGVEIGAARTVDGPRLVEKELTLAVALRAAAYLAANGYHVVVTRNADTRVNVPTRDITGDAAVSLRDDLQARIDIANNARADVLVSIHFNGFSDPTMRGTAVHYSPGRPLSAQSLKLAQALQSSLVQGIRTAGYTGLIDRGVQDDSRLFGPRAHLYILGDTATRPSAMPGALGEALFITNDDDAAQLAQPNMPQAISLAYAQGISAYFGLPFSENPAVVPAPTPTAVPPPAGPTPPAGGTGARLGKVQSGGQGVALRTEPSTAAPAARSLPDGTQVTIVQAVRGQAVSGDENRWYKVTVDSKTGFV